MTHSRSLRSVVATFVLTVLVAPLLGAVTPRAGSAAEGDAGVLQVVGNVPTPIGPQRGNQGQEVIVATDRTRRLMFMVYTDVDGHLHVVTYDMRPRIPKQVGIGDIGTVNDWGLPISPYNVAYDSKRRELAFLEPSVQAAGASAASYTTTVVVYSTMTNKIVKNQNLAAVTPGYYPLGIAYSAQDDLYYTVGEFTESGVALISGAFGKPATPGNGVLAFTPDITLKWARTVVNCPQFLYSWGYGTFVARSSDRSALYFACIGGGNAAGATNPVQSGLVRLSIVPGGTTADQVGTTEEFYAISGNYYSGGSSTGVATFDPVTERFYLQSLSFTTPGTWVFDGRLDAWVGFVSATNVHNYFIGLNEGLGHLYLGMNGQRPGSDEGPDGLLVADVRQTPVPAGDLVSFTPSYLVATDPGSNRLYVRPKDVNGSYVVVEDHTAVSHGDIAEADYDAGTAGLPDVPANEVDYTGGATGYGAQIVQVGGGSAPRSALGPTGDGNSVPPESKKLDNSRAAISARTGYIDLRTDSASASAQAFDVDAATLQSWETDDNNNDGQPDFNGGHWPYKVADCNNETGTKATTTTERGGIDNVDDDPVATVVCDPMKNSVTSDATIAESKVGAVSLDRSTYHADARRDTTNGITVNTRAEANGITLDVPGGYEVLLGRVSAVSVSIAHGRTGTARSEWWREVAGIRIVDPLGKAVFSGPGCTSHVKVVGTKPEPTDDCAVLATALNKVLPTRFQIQFPMPSVVATPKGAFAGIEQTLGQYAQQNVLNDQGVVYRGDSVGIRPAPAVITETYADTAERSRTVSYFAATQANVTFTTNPPIVGSPWDQPAPSAPSAGPVIQQGSTGGTTRETAAPVVDHTPTVTSPRPQSLTSLAGYLFTTRGLRDVVLLLLLSGLVVGGGGTAWRRRRLIDVLVTVPGKEAL